MVTGTTLTIAASPRLTRRRSSPRLPTFSSIREGKRGQQHMIEDWIEVTLHCHMISGPSPSPRETSPRLPGQLMKPRPRHRAAVTGSTVMGRPTGCRGRAMRIWRSTRGRVILLLLRFAKTLQLSGNLSRYFLEDSSSVMLKCQSCSLTLKNIHCDRKYSV